MKSKKQKSLLWKGLGILTIGGIGGVVGYGIGSMTTSSGIFTGIEIWMLVMLIPAFLVAIAIHEGGHAIAGVNVGFDFKVYIVGPFMWEKDTTGWHFKWNKNVNTAGGMVMCLPMDTVDLPRRFSIFAAGGPLASLLLTIFAYWIYAVGFKNNLANNVINGVTGSFLLFTAFLSLFFFFITAIPVHAGGFYTDGARIVRLLRGGDKAQFDSLLLKFVTQSSGGIRPKLLNLSEIEEAVSIGQRINEPFTVYLHSYLHQAALDTGDTEKAEKHLLDYIAEAENIPDGIRNIVWLDATFFYAYAKKNFAEAEKYLNQYKASALIPKAQFLATEAAMEFLKNNGEVALSKIRAAEKEIPNMIDKGVGVALAEKLKILEAQIIERTPQ